MQTHDEGEPWKDYIPSTPLRPTADPVLAEMQCDYARLRYAALALVRHWEGLGSPADEREYCNPAKTTILIDKIAAILKEHQR